MICNFIKFFITFFFIIFFYSKNLLCEVNEYKVFEIKNISVDVESTSSSKAKEIALLEAQEKGFKNLMNKILLKSEFEKIDTITIHLNQWLEKEITKHPDQWIWSHNRWKI